jgi:hypothetical protein
VVVLVSSAENTCPNDGTNWTCEHVQHDDVRPEKVVEDGPVECYRKGRADEREAENVLSALEERMAAAIIFSPEFGDLNAVLTREIIRRCARVAVEFGAQADGSGGGE